VSKKARHCQREFLEYGHDSPRFACLLLPACPSPRCDDDITVRLSGARRRSSRLRHGRARSRGGFAAPCWSSARKCPAIALANRCCRPAYPTLRRLGLVERLNSSPFPKKHGVSFCSFDGRQSQTFTFADRESSSAAQTWQVLRSEFDQLLWNTAHSHGAECRERTRVTRLLGDQYGVQGAVIQDAEGNLAEIQAQVVVDATGQHSLVGEKLGLPVTEHSPERSALWGYYENAYRDAGQDAATTHIFRSRDRRQWFWYVPLRDNVVSVGVVGAADHLLQGRGRPATVFEEELVECPIVLERLVDARLLGELRASGPLQSISRPGAGPGWVLVGDALATLDPVFCSGVSLALRSGELAADAIVAALSHQQATAAELGQFFARLSARAAAHPSPERGLLQSAVQLPLVFRRPS